MLNYICVYKLKPDNWKTDWEINVWKVKQWKSVTLLDNMDKMFGDKLM